VTDLTRNEQAQGVRHTDALARRFGRFTAVDGLKLSVRVGEVFGLLGLNGVGKSTVIKMLTYAASAADGGSSVRDRL
jgi:ABC-type multidrug transport system ATPase subunit